MRTLLLATFATLFSFNAFAATCEEQSTERKLAGAAKSSFMKKCEADGKGAGNASCEAKSAEKKLAGAAKTSFMKKCEADAKGDAKPEAKAEPKKADAKK